MNVTVALLALVFAVLVQTVAFVRWAARWEHTVRSHERELMGGNGVPGLRQRMHDVEGRVIGLEYQVRNLEGANGAGA